MEISLFLFLAWFKLKLLNNYYLFKVKPYPSKLFKYTQHTLNNYMINFLKAKLNKRLSLQRILEKVPSPYPSVKQLLTFVSLAKTLPLK